MDAREKVLEKLKKANVPDWNAHDVSIALEDAIEFLEHHIANSGGSISFKDILVMNNRTWHLRKSEVAQWERDGSIEKGAELYGVVLKKRY